MEPEVRYHMLRPGQVVARRKACPVAYIPIGTVEWHGVHNPLGADTIQAEGLASLCARTGGGLVMPPLWYGESRSESLMEANASDREKIAEKMELPLANFEPERMWFSPTDQSANYQNLLLHILAEVQSLGFELGVLVAGHYPLIDHARAAVLKFNKWRAARYGGMLAWAMLDFLLIADKYEKAGDHAGGWETSHVMHLHPETVDLSTLPPKDQHPVGTSGSRHPADATAEFGRETLEASAEIAIKEVHHRLANRDVYSGHGMSLAEGLWKQQD